MLGGAAAIAKVVVKAERREDNWTVQEVGPLGHQEVGRCLEGWEGWEAQVLLRCFEG